MVVGPGVGTEPRVPQNLTRIQLRSLTNEMPGTLGGMPGGPPGMGGMGGGMGIPAPTGEDTGGGGDAASAQRGVPVTARTPVASMSTASTRAPARAKLSALARPMPDAAAVTTAVLPAKRLDSIRRPCTFRKDERALASAEPLQQMVAGFSPVLI